VGRRLIMKRTAVVTQKPGCFGSVDCGYCKTDSECIKCEISTKCILVACDNLTKVALEKIS
jgi:hypothetical protein